MTSISRKTIWPEVGLTRPMIARASVDLPQPDFADNAQCLAAPDMKRDPVNRGNGADLTCEKDPLSDRKLNVKLSDIQQRRMGGKLALGDHVGAASGESRLDPPPYDKRRSTRRTGRQTARVRCIKGARWRIAARTRSRTGDRLVKVEFLGWA